MPAKLNLKNIAIVLQGTRYPENIGAAARAMLNMGFEQLILVDPQNYDLARINKMATHAASAVVERLEVYDTLKEALGDFNFVVGTTARLGGQRKVVSSPAKLAQKLVPLSDQNRIAVLFGPEDRGLSNLDIRVCHTLVNIPTAEFSSLNLAQAVMVTCYELFRFSLDKPGEFAPRLANLHELDAMYDQLKDVLMQISFINPDNPDYFMNNLRHFFGRMQLRAKEVQIIRGICRQVNWYGEKRYRDGLSKKDE
ncbi:MAG: RNA methyltransferase [Desulfobacterales bacterium]|jgi:tRNA/rRNA methyltransferase